MTTSAAPAASGRSPLAIIFFTVFIDLVGFGIVIPILPRYAQDYGASEIVAGLLLSTYSLMQFLAAPFWGRLSDRIGRRPVLLISLAASTIGYVIFALARSVPVLFLSRFVAGIGGANVAVAQAYIADITTEANRTRGMGMVGMAFGLGFILGPVIYTVAAPTLGEQAPGWIAALVCALNLIAAVFRLPETHAPDAAVSLSPREGARAFGDIFRSIRYAFRLPRVRLALALFCIAVFAFSNFEATLALYLGQRFHLPKGKAGYYFAYIGLLAALVQGGLVGRLSKRFGEVALVKAGMLLTAVGLFLFVPLRTAWLLHLTTIPFALGFGTNNPSLSSLVSRGAPKQDQGRVLGAMQALGSLMRIIGPPAGTALFGSFGSSSPYLIAGSITAVGGVIAFARLNAQTAAPRVGST